MFKTKLTLALTGFLLLVLCVGAIFCWGVERTLYFQERARVDHVELEAYLAVSGETYRLFRQYRTALGEGRPDELSDLRDSQMRLEMCLRELQRLTTDEIAQGGPAGLRESERGEFELLAGLTSEIQLLLTELQSIERLFAQGLRGEGVARLTMVLEERIERTISGMIEQAILRERQEVAESDADAQAVARQMHLAGLVGGALAVAFAIGSIVLLRRSLSRPVDLLTSGTARWASGDLSHRIAMTGRDEFARLAGSFNELAVDLERQQAELQEARRTLERKVTARTQELERANRALEAADRVRRRFFADISHELRTPITIIRGEGEVTLRGKEKAAEEYQASLQRIVEQSEQLGRLVDDLLLIARSNAGATQLRKGAVDLSALVRCTCDDARALAARRHCRRARGTGPRYPDQRR